MKTCLKYYSISNIIEYILNPGGYMKKVFQICLSLLIALSTVFAYSSRMEEKLFYNQGFFGASFLYQTYFCNGMASDAWTKETYTAENAKIILQSNRKLLELSIKTLNELTLFSISAEDRNTLLQMVDIAEDLKKQSIFMISYIDSQNQDDLNQYNYYRTSAWEKVKKLMDIK